MEFLAWREQISIQTFTNRHRDLYPYKCVISARTAALAQLILACGLNILINSISTVSHMQDLSCFLRFDMLAVNPIELSIALFIVLPEAMNRGFVFLAEFLAYFIGFFANCLSARIGIHSTLYGEWCAVRIYLASITAYFASWGPEFLLTTCVSVLAYGPNRLSCITRSECL
jgi:hypothetical protein